MTWSLKTESWEDLGNELEDQMRTFKVIKSLEHVPEWTMLDGNFEKCKYSWGVKIAERT